MTYSTPGASTSPVEIGNIDGHGLWLLVEDKEYFLPYEGFPWFRNATVAQIVNVELLHGDHLCWPDLDVDLAVESLAKPESFPLIFQ